MISSSCNLNFRTLAMLPGGKYSPFEDRNSAQSTVHFRNKEPKFLIRSLLVTKWSHSYFQPLVARSCILPTGKPHEVMFTNLPYLLFQRGWCPSQTGWHLPADTETVPLTVCSIYPPGHSPEWWVCDATRGCLGHLPSVVCASLAIQWDPWSDLTLNGML